LRLSISRLLLLSLLGAAIAPQPAPAGEDAWTTVNNAALEKYQEGEDGQARHLFKVAIGKATRGDCSDGHLADSLYGLADLYFMQMRFKRAQVLYRRAIAADEKGFGPDDPRVAVGLSKLVSAYRRDGRALETEPLLLRALAIREKALGPEDQLVGNTLLDLTTLYCEQGKLKEAEQVCRRALEIREKSAGANSLRLVPPLCIYAELLRKLGREPEAVGFESRAKAIEASGRQ